MTVGSVETFLGLGALGGGRGAFCFTSTVFFEVASFLVATLAFRLNFSLLVFGFVIVGVFSIDAFLVTILVLAFSFSFSAFVFVFGFSVGFTLAFTLTLFFTGAFFAGAFFFTGAFLAFDLFFSFAFAVALRFAAIDLSVSTKWVLKRAANLTR